MKLLGLFLKITFSFYIIISLLMLYFSLFKSKLEYASLTSNSVTVTDSSELKRIQEYFLHFASIFFFQNMAYHYENI
jgi:hypothetical protein